VEQIPTLVSEIWNQAYATVAKPLVRSQAFQKRDQRLLG